MAKLDVKERAYRQIKNDIIFGELAPGTFLNERELAEAFGISRTPLRELLQRLRFQRLIEIKPRRGVLVAPLDYFTVRSAFEARLPVESTVAALAARRADKADLQAMGELLERIRAHQAEGNVRKVIELDRAFHQAMAKAARNDILSEVMEDMHNVCLRFWYASRETLGESYDGPAQLEEILRAVTARDEASAAKLQAAHLSGFLAVMGDLSVDLPEYLIETSDIPVSPSGQANHKE